MGIVGVLALAAGWMIWRDRSTPGPTTTTALLSAATTTSTTVMETTTSAVTTTTTEVQRLAEVEAILTDLWFGWFDAIYRKDADALWDVVATTPYHQAGVRAMDRLEFESAPDADVLGVLVEGILLDRSDCLVVQNTISVPFLVGDPVAPSVDVLWSHEGTWRLATSWVHPNDLWLADCDEVEREETP